MEDTKKKIEHPKGRVPRPESGKTKHRKTQYKTQDDFPQSRQREFDKDRALREVMQYGH